MCYIKRDDGTGKFYPRSDEGIFLSYSLKIIVEWENVKVDKKFGVKERILDYIFLLRGR